MDGRLSVPPRSQSGLLLVCPERQVLIIGAGPAGLQLAFFLKQYGVNYVVLEREPGVGSFFGKFPRHRRLISINKPNTGFDDPEINLRWDWHSLLGDDHSQRFTRYSSDYFPRADDYVEYLQDYRSRHGLEVRTEENVVSIVRREQHFRVACADGREYTAENVVVATGLSCARKPSFPGATHVEQYSDVSTDPAAFRGQRVLILGKGNSAFETANNMAETAAAVHLLSPSPVRLAWRSQYVGHLRAVNCSFLDTYRLRSQNTLINGVIDKIERLSNQTQVHFSYADTPTVKVQMAVDRVISCVGFAIDATIFAKGCSPQLCHDGRYPILTSAWESVNVPHLYFAGGLMHGRDYQRASSGFVHGFRYNVMALAKILRVRRCAASWESRDMALSAENLGGLLLRRATAAAALFHQPGYFCDVFVFSSDGQNLSVYQDMPLEYVREFHFGSSSTYYTLTMEYGYGGRSNPLSARPTPDDGLTGALIHPVIRRMSCNRCVAEYHVQEDLENQWHKPAYAGPLIEWLQRDIRATVIFMGQHNQPTERRAWHAL